MEDMLAKADVEQMLNEAEIHEEHYPRSLYNAHQPGETLFELSPYTLPVTTAQQSPSDRYFPKDVPTQHQVRLHSLFSFFSYLDPNNQASIIAKIELNKAEIAMLNAYGGTNKLYNKLVLLNYRLPAIDSGIVNYKYLVGVLTNKVFCIIGDEWKPHLNPKSVTCPASALVYQIMNYTGPNLGYDCEKAPCREYLINVLHSIDDSNVLFHGPKVVIDEGLLTCVDGNFKLPESFRGILRVDKRHEHNLNALGGIESARKLVKRLGLMERNIVCIRKAVMRIKELKKGLPGIEFEEAVEKAFFRHY